MNRDSILPIVFRAVVKMEFVMTESPERENVNHVNRDILVNFVIKNVVVQIWDLLLLYWSFLPPNLFSAATELTVTECASYAHVDFLVPTAFPTARAKTECATMVFMGTDTAHHVNQVFMEKIVI